LTPAERKHHSRGKKKALLAATNEIVDEINDEMVEQMPCPLYTHTSVDTVGDTDNLNLPCFLQNI